MSMFLLLMVSTAAGQTIYVDADGTADFNTIQAAIDDSNDGDTVIVSDGTYTGPGNRDIDFLGKAITVRSIDPKDPNIVAATIIDCNGSSSEPHRGFKFHCGEQANSVIIGLTIINGYGPEDKIGRYSYSAGGAIYCDGSSPSITDCIMTGNSAGYHGGAVCNRVNSNPTLANCTFIDNSAKNRGGAVYNWDNSSPTLRNCTFTNNYARVGGGGFYSEYRCTPVIVSCSFNNNSAHNTGNGGGAISINWGSATIANCTFVGNFALSRGGAICNYQSNPTIYNCIFIWNSAGSFSAAIHNNSNSRPIIANCTFTANSAPTGRALGSSRYGSEPLCDIQLTNSILWDGGNEIVNLDGSKITVTYSDVEGGWPGEGNIDADPFFVETGYWDANDVWIDGDYHLLLDSPCINAGDPNYVAEPNETDLDGKPRVIGGRIDMGAYEYSPPIPAEVRIVPRSINLASMGKWITCYIQLPEDYNVADIEADSVLLEYEIQAQSLSLNEGQQVATAKFNRSDVQEILDAGEVELTITGRLTNGFAFEGTDVIRVIDKGRGK
ncbi:hypothetical protein ES703_92609 [subsurface metagenome]